MTPHKPEACRKENEMLMEYDMIEPSKSPWACSVTMAKKKDGQLRFRCGCGNDKGRMLDSPHRREPLQVG